MRGGFGRRNCQRSLGEAGRGVLTGFGMASLAKVECLELGLGLLRVVFGDVAHAEAVYALCEDMVFVVKQGERHGGIFRQGREFHTGWGPQGREDRDAHGRRSWTGCWSWGAGGLSGRRHVHVWLVRDGRLCTGVGGALYLDSLQVEGGEEGAGEGKLLLEWCVSITQALDGKHVEDDGGQLDAARQEEFADVADARHVGGKLLAVPHVQPEELVEFGKN